jgi:hypothetical protein
MKEKMLFGKGKATGKLPGTANVRSNEKAVLEMR